MTRRRLDTELVRRGLVDSREQAVDAIAAGLVLVSGTPARKPARLVDAAEPVVISGPPPRFVSRGGEKLDAAIAGFAVDVAGRRALDAGASTGGFTDCLLQRGAAEVVAVDVGYGQLHGRLRSDPRVRALDRTNVRHLTVEHAGGRPFGVIVADLSFISLRTVAPALLGDLAAPDADVIFLVKPQFEAGRVEAAKSRGVIRSPDVWRRTLGEVGITFARHGAAMMDAMVSPLKGADGNVEFLVHVRPHQSSARPRADLDAVLDAAVAAAVERDRASERKPEPEPE